MTFFFSRWLAVKSASPAQANSRLGIFPTAQLGVPSLFLVVVGAFGWLVYTMLPSTSYTMNVTRVCLLHDRCTLLVTLVLTLNVTLYPLIIIITTHVIDHPSVSLTAKPSRTRYSDMHDIRRDSTAIRL